MTVGVRRDIVVIGGSAGALDPLRQIVADLPPDLPAAVVVCLHTAATARSALVSILDRAGGMQAVRPRDGDPIKPGYVYVPTPDHHLELTGRGFRLSSGPRINGSRPAVDVLFRTAAAAFGPRVIGVVLSGGLDDGSNGLIAVKAAGGAAIVQSPDDAMVESMPRNAMELAAPDHVLVAGDIAPAIVSLVGERVPEEARELEKVGGLEMEPVGARDTPGQVTGITCPDCHGSIWVQADAAGQITFACRIGHKYSPESFFEIQAENVENALWAGVRSLEEQAALAGVMAVRAGKVDDAQAVDRFEKRRQLAEEYAETLRGLLLDRTDDVA